MAQEIERKFLVDPIKWKQLTKPEGVRIKQCYIVKEIEKTIRIRIKGDKGYFCIKGKTINFTRTEFEYEIPLNDALEMISLYGDALIEKLRFEITVENHIWEVDVFEGKNKGLIFAEIELEDENELFTKPTWVLEEVSHDSRYYNSNLMDNPFINW